MNIRHINTVEYEELIKEFLVQIVRKIVVSKVLVGIEEIPLEYLKDELGQLESYSV
jgi:hypothetical protein